MPLFIFLSGLFAKTDNIIRRIAKIYIPYIIISISAVLIWYFVAREDFYYIKQSFFNIIVGGFAPGFGVYPVEAVWYLITLSIIIILFSLIARIRLIWIRLLTIIALTVSGILISGHRDVFNMYFNIDVSLILLPYFFIGYYMKTILQKMKSDKIIILILVILTIIYCILSFINGNVNIYKANIGRDVVLYYITAVIGIVCLMYVSYYISCGGIVHKILQELGKHTLYIMGYHQLIREIINKYNLISNTLVKFFVILLGSYFISKIIEYVIKKTKKTVYILRRKEYDTKI